MTMRNLLTLTAAGSVLALAAGTLHAAALSPGPKVISSEGLAQKAQKGDEKGPGARGQEGGGKGLESGSKGREPGLKGSESGAGQDKGGEKGAAQNRPDRGAQMRSGDKGDKGARSTERRTDIDVRGRRDERSRAERRTRVDVDVERRRQAGGGRDTGVNARGFGYTSGNCQEIIRRYKQCVGH